jgi:UDP-N-acetylmuramyl pentapeptide phosphotransferase/UDP-N-acetylglucosamine-1-phosphate transferase
MLGIVDDLWSVGPWVKIVVQLTAGLLVFYHLGIRIENLSNPISGVSSLAAFSLPATLFWILLVTNAFNIVDGLDGLASGVCFIALSCMFLVSLQMGNMAIALVVAPLAGAVLGFLRYNFNPASIFLGDSGSLFLGFQLGVLSIVGSQKSSTAITVAAPLFILALPLVETAISATRRFLSGRSILQPDSGHIHHRLMRLGFTPRRAAGLLYFGSAAFGLTSLFIIQSNATVVGLIALLLAAVTWVGIQRLGYTEFAEVNSALKRFVHQRRIIRNGIISRRLADDLCTATSVNEAWHLLKATAEQLGFSYVALKLNSQDHDDDGIQGGRYAKRLGRRLEVETETSFAVAITGPNGQLGEVVLSRSSEAEPLHSELPLLISAVAHGLPRVLQRTFESPIFALPADKPPLDTIAGRMSAPSLEPAKPSGTICPACAAAAAHRSRSKSRLERLRKSHTAKRIYECEECGWRGWILPQHSRHEEGAVIACDPPDLQAIDAAIAGVRYRSGTNLSVSLRRVAQVGKR